MAVMARHIGRVRRVRCRKIAMLREHSARKIPIARAVHRNCGRAAAGLAGLADQIATLHLINIIVIRVPIILMLAAATIENGIGRARGRERCDAQEKRGNDGGAPQATRFRSRLLRSPHDMLLISAHAISGEASSQMQINLSGAPALFLAPDPDSEPGAGEYSPMTWPST